MMVSFIIPFHNEEKNCLPMLTRVIDYARSHDLKYEVIPIDDRSTDQTTKILKTVSNKFKQVKPVFRITDTCQKGNTMGKALIEGTRRAKGDIVIWTMGDLADDSETYGRIIDSLQDGADLVFASRYIPGGSRGNLDFIKATLSSSGTLLARWLFGIPVHDITNAFRGFKKSLFESITLNSPGFPISPELAIKAHLSGYKLVEVPTVYTNRKEGISNFKMFSMVKSYLLLYLRLFVNYKILRKPITTPTSPVLIS